MDTIYALSSGQGRAGVAVIRISGSEVGRIIEQMIQAKLKPRIAHLKALFIPNTQELLDSALVLWFPAPHSFTGEDCLELHTHGSTAVVKAVLAALSHFEHVRAAEAGEFTRRAFLNGKMDLTEVEGLSDLLAAETELQRKQAMHHASGQLRKQADIWRVELVRIMALLEATIDFSDEGDVAANLAHQARAELLQISLQWENALGRTQFAERIRDGFTVAIVGAPNAGKSSLLNALIGRDVAIISSIPGTTRDIIEAYLDLDGVPVKLIDTAGIRDSQDEIEQEGIRRAKNVIQTSDFILHIHHPGQDTLILNDIIDLDKIIHVESHADLKFDGYAKSDLKISSTTGQGIAELLTCIRSKCIETNHVNESPLIARQRHAECFQAALLHVSRALGYDFDVMPELAAEELRAAALHLGRLSGKIDVEDLLDFIFHEFCIGK